VKRSGTVDNFNSQQHTKILKRRQRDSRRRMRRRICRHGICYDVKQGREGRAEEEEEDVCGKQDKRGAE